MLYNDRIDGFVQMYEQKIRFIANGQQRTRPTPSNEQEQFNDIAQLHKQRKPKHNVKNNIVMEHRQRRRQRLYDKWSTDAIHV